MDRTVGVVLAGGLARRMGGGDKGRLQVGGRPILRRVTMCLAAQVPALALNANGDPARFADLGLPVLADSVPGWPGPLAGVLAALDWAAGEEAGWCVTAPGDCPFLPGDLVRRLHAARGAGQFACASSGGRSHPVIAVWPVECRAVLREALAGGLRKVGAFAAQSLAEWPTIPCDPFLNVNTPEDLVLAERLASAQQRL